MYLVLAGESRDKKYIEYFIEPTFLFADLSSFVSKVSTLVKSSHKISGVCSCVEHRTDTKDSDWVPGHLNSAQRTEVSTIVPETK